MFNNLKPRDTFIVAIPGYYLSNLTHFLLTNSIPHHILDNNNGLATLQISTTKHEHTLVNNHLTTLANKYTRSTK